MPGGLSAGHVDAQGDLIGLASLLRRDHDFSVDQFCRNGVAAVLVLLHFHFPAANCDSDGVIKIIIRSGESVILTGQGDILAAESVGQGHGEASDGDGGGLIDDGRLRGIVQNCIFCIVHQCLDKTNLGIFQLQNLEFQRKRNGIDLSFIAVANNVDFSLRRRHGDAGDLGRHQLQH